MERKAQIFNESEVNRALMRLSYEIIEKAENLDNLLLAGIKTRGIPISQRIQANILKISGKLVPLATLDITFYRDDLSKKEEVPTLLSSFFPLSPEGREVVLCDDVLYTGRTARAAIDAVLSKGRAKRISLAVLIDRGHRELPIRPDYTGKNVPTSKKEIVKVYLEETDGKNGVDIFEE